MDPNFSEIFPRSAQLTIGSFGYADASAFLNSSQRICRWHCHRGMNTNEMIFKLFR